MRSVLLVVCLAACGSTAGSAERTPQLGPLPIADPAQPGGAYLTSVALQLQPGWSQFLEDCRLRLPADHPLNRVKLAAIAELVIGRDGHVIESSIAASSGNPDFDKAVKDAVREAKLPAPPIEALSDDDRVYLRWMFARDRRQAGPATAELVHKELPLAQAIARFIAAHDLGRAARRIHDGNAEAVTAVMTATLRDAIENGVDTAVQRAAVTTIGDAKLAPFVKPIAGLLDATDDQLRAAATITIGELGDRAMVKPLAERLARHLAAHDRLAIADAQALVALGADPAPVIEGALPDPIALEASAKAPRWTPKLVAAMKGNALTRTAACIALAPHLDHAEVLAAITRGLADPDASVRASCAAAAPPRLVEPLLHDRDRAVRASAVLAIGTADPSKIAGALADPEPELRAAAWEAFARAKATPNRDGLSDPVAEVRFAAIPNARDDDSLRLLATSDVAPTVRSRALEEYVRRRGRAWAAAQLLAELAAAPANSGDRVRIARAWLLAR